MNQRANKEKKKESKPSEAEKIDSTRAPAAAKKGSEGRGTRKSHVPGEENEGIESVAPSRSGKKKKTGKS